MASTTSTPLATTATIASPFLRLAPELRNRIYKYTFAEAKKTGLVPHAWTQTKKQIRNETRAMYYASIECIEIPLHIFTQYDRAVKWLAEEDWSIVPVLPDITLLTYNARHHRDVTFSCRRGTIVPAHEFPLQLAELQGVHMSDQETLRAATIDTCTKCLGFDPEEFSLEEEAPETFTQVIRGVGPWQVRRLEYRTENIPLFTTFRTLAEAKQGWEWTRDDLRAVVGWLYTSIHTCETLMRRAQPCFGFYWYLQSFLAHEIQNHLLTFSADRAQWTVHRENGTRRLHRSPGAIATFNSTM